MKFTIKDILTHYFVRIDDYIERYKTEIDQDKEMIKKDPNNSFLKWEDALIEDQKKLEEYKEKKEKLKKYLKNNWEKLEKMEIK